MVKTLNGGVFHLDYNNKTDFDLQYDYEHKADYYEKYDIEKEMGYRGYIRDEGEWKKKGEDDDIFYDSNSGGGLLSLVFPLFGVYLILGLVTSILWQPVIEPYLTLSNQWYPKDVYINLSMITDKVLLHVFSIVIIAISIIAYWVIGKIIPFVSKPKKYLPFAFLFAAPAVMIWEGMQVSSFPILSTIGFIFTLLGSVYLVYHLKIRWKVGIALMLVATVGFILSGNTYIHSFFVLYLTAASFLFVPNK